MPRAARTAAKPTPPEWPAARVEQRPAASLVPYANNARTHSDEQVAQIAASIVQWGWTMPILVDEAGGVIAGHGRLLAAQRLGIEVVPVMVASGWSADQKRAYAIADNKLALNAGWDTDKLRFELKELDMSGFDLGPVGFTGLELAGLFGAVEPATDPGESAYREQYGVIVMCRDDQEQESVYNQLRDEGYNVKVVTT